MRNRAVGHNVAALFRVFLCSALAGNATKNTLLLLLSDAQQVLSVCPVSFTVRLILITKTG